MGALIFALVFLVIGVLAIAIARKIRVPVVRPIGVGLIVLAVVITGLDSITMIPVRTVGIELSFNKPVHTLSNGLHLVAPWENIDKEWDGSVQTQRMPVTVRLANQTTAEVDVTVQWNLHPDADVLELYRRYKTFENVKTNLVERQLSHSLNIEFSKFDPLRTINTDDKSNSGSAANPTIDQLAAAARTDLQSAVGNAIQIDSITIPIVHFDSTTEDRLKQYQQALADTRIAEQKEKTAEQIKAANDALAAGSAISNPGVQYQNCLNMIQDLAKQNHLKELPPSFNCGSGSTPIIIGQK